jgi:hypothetical protein
MASKDKDKEEILTLSNLESVLAQDDRVKLAGVDVDGTRPPTLPPTAC